MFDEGGDVFARDVRDGFEEAMSRHKHLAPHVTLVLLRGGCTGQAKQFVEHLRAQHKGKYMNVQNLV